MKKIRYVRRLVAVMIWMFIAAGLILRFTVRDRYLRWSVIYYTTPIPVLPILFLLAGIAVPPELNWWRKPSLETRRRRFSPGRLNLSLGLLSICWTVYAECCDRGRPASPNDIRVVFWNVARVQAGTDRLAKELLTWKSPVIALVEADRKYKIRLDEWQDKLPGYTVVPTLFGGLVAVEGTASTYRERFLATGCFCQQFDLKWRESEFTLLLVDVSSDLRYSRKLPLEALAKIAEELSDRPLMIAGDFNTPDDSIWFTPLRSHVREAFRDRGTGYAATWPMPLPVLTLDQIWVNDLVEVSQCKHGWSMRSDHRPVIADVSFKSPR